VGGVRGPEKTIIAQQFDIPLGRVLFSTLKEKLFARQQHTWQYRTSPGVTRSNLSSILLIRNGAQPQPASRKPSLSRCNLFIKPENIMLVNWRIWESRARGWRLHWAAKKRSLSLSEVQEWTERA
jgi:hypothetical protein